MLRKTVILFITALVAMFFPGAVHAGQSGVVIHLEGSNEVPPVATTASGTCRAHADKDSGVWSLVCTHNVQNPTAAHIHSGPPGSIGPVVFDLGDGTSPIKVQDMTTPEIIDSVLEGDFYVNVHSTAFPGGEIRGPIKGCGSNSAATSLCLQEDRFRVEVDWRISPTGPSLLFNAVETASEAGYLFDPFFPDNIELITNVIDGCSVNNRFWVFAAGVTDVEFTITVTDTKTRTVKTYNNVFFTPFQPVNDFSAFATCP